jgi:hypothetical protein
MAKRKKKTKKGQKQIPGMWLQMARDDVPEDKTPYEMRNQRDYELIGDQKLGDLAWKPGAMFRDSFHIREKLTEQQTKVIKRQIAKKATKRAAEVLAQKEEDNESRI